MKLLVTGGAGFMGSNFIHYALKKHPIWRIINLDKLTYAGNLDNLKDIAKNRRYQFVKGDICDPKIVNKLAKKVDAILNYAAETHVDRSILDPAAFVKTDVLGTYTLLEAAKNYKIKRFIQIGTDESYGSIKKGKFTENSPLKPNSPYSASKAGADLLCRSYFKTFKTPVIITRSCNNFGPNQYPEKLIPLFITNILEGKKVPVYGKGNQSRTWIYVEDHSRAIDLILQKGQPGEIYNISTGQEKNNIKVTKMILKELKAGPEIIEHVKDRPGHDFRYGLAWSKLKKLGFKPEYNFQQGLQKTIEWYQKNQKWWQKIKSGEYAKYYQKQYQKR